MTEVSVIIPTTGRRPQMLRRALKSVQAQTLRPREVIVVFDGAKPGELGCFNGEVELRSLCVETRKGASAARNLGARAARSAFLAFLDDDDAWKPEYLACAFAEGAAVDLILTAFEKHRPEDVSPEKVPPERLSVDAFLVKNPGLRGSNLLISRAVFDRLGGFDSELPAINDLDLGIRLAELRDLRYRRVIRPLVEFHSHRGQRLSTPGCPENLSGLEAYLIKHGWRMSPLDEARFRERALKLWRVEVWQLDWLERRLAAVKERGELAPAFPGLLHAAETILLEQLWGLEEGRAERVLAFVVRLCRDYEDEARRPTPPRLRFAMITTDAPEEVEAFASSLERELERFFWAQSSRKSSPPEIHLLLNNRNEEASRRCREIARNRSGALRWLLHELPGGGRSLGEARAKLVSWLRQDKQQPSREAPIWIVDEDLRFDALLPGASGWRRGSAGSILHRWEAFVRSSSAAGFYGGTTGAAPVPALTTILRQLEDLKSSRLEPGPWIEALADYARRDDAYYDLSRSSEAEPDRPSRAALSKNRLAEDVHAALQRGLPVTRPVPLRLRLGPTSAWGSSQPSEVVGGNVTLLAPELLEPAWFLQLEWRGVLSRRADTCWALRAAQSGSPIEARQITLYHDREGRRSRSWSAEEQQLELWRDVLGFGLYQSLKQEPADPPDEASVLEASERFVEERLAELRATLLRSLRVLDELDGAATGPGQERGLRRALQAALEILRETPSRPELLLRSEAGRLSRT